MRIQGYWPPHDHTRRILWIPYARIAHTNIYYEAHFAPLLPGYKKLLGFTRIRREPVTSQTITLEGDVLEPHQNIDVRQVLDSCGQELGKAKPAWRIYLGGRRATLLRVSALLRERILFPTPPPRIRTEPRGLEETLASMLLMELKKRLPSDPRVTGYYLRPFTCEEGVLKDLAGLEDGHERLISRYASPCMKV